VQLKYVENDGLVVGTLVGTVGAIVVGVEVVEVIVGATVLSMVGTATPP
jgi:hypothetical protein